MLNRKGDWNFRWAQTFKHPFSFPKSYHLNIHSRICMIMFKQAFQLIPPRTMPISLMGCLIKLSITARLAYLFLHHTLNFIKHISEAISSNCTENSIRFHMHGCWDGVRWPAWRLRWFRTFDNDCFKLGNMLSRIGRCIELL